MSLEPLESHSGSPLRDVVLPVTGFRNIDDSRLIIYRVYSTQKRLKLTYSTIRLVDKPLDPEFYLSAGANQGYTPALPTKRKIPVHQED